MIELSDGIQSFVWPGFHMIELSDGTRSFVWPGFHMIERSDGIQSFAWPGLHTPDIRRHTGICVARLTYDQAIRQYSHFYGQVYISPPR